jgi:hypothetical protein
MHTGKAIVDDLKTISKDLKLEKALDVSPRDVLNAASKGISTLKGKFNGWQDKRLEKAYNAYIDKHQPTVPKADNQQ